MKSHEEKEEQLLSILAERQPVSWETYCELAPLFSTYDDSHIQMEIMAKVASGVSNIYGLASYASEREYWLCDYEEELSLQLGDILWHIALGQAKGIHYVTPLDFFFFSFFSRDVHEKVHGHSLLDIKRDIEAELEQKGIPLGGILWDSLNRRNRLFPRWYKK
jgi:hypothetical protein